MANQLPIPRAPRIVAPKSLAPTDILSAVVQTQKSMYEDLIVRPLQAIGMKAPEQPPTPEMMLQQVAPQIEKAAKQMAPPLTQGIGESSKRGELPKEPERTRERVGRGSLG